jgi:enamine deaminase RidA (YjgF/YER057c/UK114 family)
VFENNNLDFSSGFPMDGWMNPESNLARLGIQLKTPPAPVGNYLPCRMSGNLIFLSGSICLEDGQLRYRGAVGREYTVEEGYLAARLCACNQLAILKSEVGDLARVRRVVTVTGFVWGVEGFADSPRVINGASDLYGEVFGESGRHARAAVSVSGLPGGSAVEIQTVFEVF